MQSFTKLLPAVTTCLILLVCISLQQNVVLWRELLQTHFWAPGGLYQGGQTTSTTASQLTSTLSRLRILSCPLKLHKKENCLWHCRKSGVRRREGATGSPTLCSWATLIQSCVLLYLSDVMIHRCIDLYFYDTTTLTHKTANPLCYVSCIYLKSSFSSVLPPLPLHRNRRFLF